MAELGDNPVQSKAPPPPLGLEKDLTLVSRPGSPHRPAPAVLGLPASTNLSAISFRRALGEAGSSRVLVGAFAEEERDVLKTTACRAGAPVSRSCWSSQWSCSLLQGGHPEASYRNWEGERETGHPDPEAKVVVPQVRLNLAWSRVGTRPTLVVAADHHQRMSLSTVLSTRCRSSVCLFRQGLPAREGPVLETAEAVPAFANIK